MPGRAPWVSFHLCAAAEDKPKFSLCLRRRQLLRDLRIRNHAIKQAFFSSLIFASAVGLQVEAAIRRRALEMKRRRLQAGLEVLAKFLFDPLRKGVAIKTKRHVEAQVRHEVAADQLIAIVAVRRCGEGFERKPRRLDAAERKHYHAPRFDRQELPLAVLEQIDAGDGETIPVGVVPGHLWHDEFGNVRIRHQKNPTVCVIGALAAYMALAQKGDARLTK